MEVRVECAQRPNYSYEMASKIIENSRNDTAQKILTSAFKCVSVKGCASVSLRDIADEAGIALSQIDYHFGNREQLFAAVLRTIKQDYISAVEVKMAASDSLNGKLQGLIRYNQELLQTNKRLNRVLLEFFGLAMWSKFFRKEMNAFINDVSKVIENQLHLVSAKEKSLSSLSPATLTTVVMGTSLGLTMLHQVGSEPKEALNGFDLLLQTIKRTIEKE